MMRLVDLALLCIAVAVTVLLLAACGGGGSTATEKNSFAFFGDSATAAPWLNDRPVPQIARLAGVAATDHSVPGMTSVAALPRFEQTLLHDPSTHVVLRFGGGDCALYLNSGLAAFEHTLYSMIAVTKSFGKIPLLTTTVRLAPWDALSEADNLAYMASLEKYNETIIAVGRVMGVQVIDVYGQVPFYGREDLFDMVHPNQEYSNRISEYIAGQLPVRR
jgi:hypothetical protein